MPVWWKDVFMKRKQQRQGNILQCQPMLFKRSEFSYASKCENDAEAYPVRAEKNDIIQTSCQHSPIPLSEGECGASWLPTPYREKGPLCFLHIGQPFFLLLEYQENLAAHTNNNVSKLKVNEMITIMKKKRRVNHFQKSRSAQSQLTSAHESRYF